MGSELDFSYRLKLDLDSMYKRKGSDIEYQGLFLTFYWVLAIAS
jgi:hypothetical protein